MPEQLRRAERKLVSIVFIDMVGFTSLGHQFDAEVVKEAMTAFFRRLAAVARLHGGWVEKFIGDAMMTVYGIPQAREDDTERALNAALDMHAAMDEINTIWSERLQRKIQIRIGVNTGVVIAGAIGEGRASDYGVSGDVVNTAQRLESAAEPGETIVGEQTRELAGRGFLFQSIPPLTLKGKPEPVPAFKLLGRAEAVTELFESIPLVGRDDELSHLTAMADLVRAGGRAAVAVRGETGSGKTRLIEALRGSRAAEEFRSVAPRTDGAAPLALARQIARALAPADANRAQLASKLLGGDDALAVGLVGFLLDDEPDGDSPVASLEAASRNELLGDLLGRMLAAAPQPLLIALDDAEGADGASLQLIARAIREGEDHALTPPASSSAGLSLSRWERGRGRWLLVTTSGAAWSPPWPLVATVPLEDLSADELRALLAAAMGSEELDQAAADALVDAASGNPLALTELAYAYRTSGKLPQKRAGGVAGTILALVQSRIDAVDEHAKRVLQVGAVVGATFSLRIVEAVLGSDVDAAGAAGRLRRRNLLNGPDDELRFAQSAIRMVAYDSLMAADRRGLHAAVASALESTGVDDPFVLAHHHGRGGDDAAAVAALARAGEAHLAAGDVTAALGMLRAGVERLGEEPELAGVHRAFLLGRIADVLALQGDVEGARATFQEATDALDVGLLRGELYRRQAALEHRGGDDDAALDALQMARDDVTMTELEGTEPVEAIFTALAGMATTAARIHLGGGRADEASWEARQAVEMLSHLSQEQAAQPTARRPVAEANLILAEVMLAEGDAERAAEHADDARLGYEELRDLAGGLRADLCIARARAMKGSTVEAQARIEAALAMARRLGDQDGIAIGEAALADLSPLPVGEG